MKLFTLSLLATGVAMSIGSASLAQGTQQTIPVLKTDVVRVATGFRASKIIGEASSTMQTKPSAKWMISSSRMERRRS